MTVRTKIRLTLVASAVALAFAAPSAFAQAGSTFRGIHTDPGGTPDAPAAAHTEKLMDQRTIPGGLVRDTGRWVGNTHIDAGGTPDAPAASHTRQVMEVKIVPSGLVGVLPQASAKY